MKNILKRGLIGSAILIVSIIAMFITDFYEFDKPSQAQSFYPPSVNFKEAVSSALKEILWQNPDVIRDILWAKDTNFFTLFESLDGFDVNDGTGTVETGVAGTQLTLTTTAINNEFAELTKKPSQQGLYTFSQSGRFRTNFNTGSVANVTVWIVHGSLSGQAYGFKIINNSLYGFTRDSGGTEATVLLQTISASYNYNIEARYMPDQKVVFLADDPTTTPITKIRELGILKTNLPTPAATINSNLLDIKLQTNTTAVKTMTISFFQYNQSRDILQY